MAVINTNLVCDLQKAVKVEYIDGVLFSQDNQANKINVTVLDGGEPATISGTVSANIVRSDGGTVAATGGSITGNVASITLPAAAYAVPGVVSIVVKLTVSGVITTIAAIVGNMYRSSTDTAIDPGTVMPSIQTLISQIDAAVASIPADYSSLWTKLAPAFSTDASYVAGQYVTHNSGLYRFNTTHTGGWSSSDVTAVNLGGEITDLKSTISEKTRNIWTYGDQQFVKQVAINVDIPAGTYTISAEVLRNATSSSQNSRIIFYDAEVATALANPYLPVNSGRQSTTFTLSETAKKVYILSAANESTSTGVDAYWKNIQLESGSSATAFIQPLSACDYINREKTNEIENNVSAIEDLTENTKNLWSYGNKSGTKLVSQNYAFIEGTTYTVSMNVNSNATEQISRIDITDSGSNSLLHDYVRNDGTRQHITFTAPANATKIYIYASNTSTNSEGYTVSVTGIQLETGNGPTIYVPYGKTGIDEVSRNELDAIQGKVIGCTLIEDKTYGPTGAFPIVVSLPKNYYMSTLVVSCDAKFTRSSGVVKCPTIYISSPNARNLDRETTHYQIGTEGVYSLKEWRAPAFVWSDDNPTLYIDIPTGCELTIRNLRYRFDNSTSVVCQNGVKFYARPGTCNFVEELTVPSMQMSLRHGYDTYVVIPKVSSDGVWFAYHDDTFDHSTTKLRMSDGSAISDTTYDGKPFHKIPFSYLAQYRYTRYGMFFGDETVMKLDDCFSFLAKTGMKLRFSMHPRLGDDSSENQSNLALLRRLVEKYGLLKNLTLIVDYIDDLFAVFGNDIDGYVFPNANDSTWDGPEWSGQGDRRRIDSALNNANAAKETYGITTNIYCGMWVGGLFTDLEKAETLVNNIISAGYSAEVFSNTYTGIDGQSHNYLWGADMQYLMSIGITGFTDGYNSSIGLNW